ncbi:unnamed protein product [marine sediment metagenome]|uniref:Aspartyl/glutamyl-tRNA(Asn/Gln) amidotransferase subunit C n=1 Tax=marine sediment metagenome TaxID=412755 RepID=X1IEA0_9ZZZZ
MAKKIDRKEVKYIAHLARLQLTSEEEEKFSRQLGEILTYVDKLKEVNTRNVPPYFPCLCFKERIQRGQTKEISFPARSPG